MRWRAFTVLGELGLDGSIAPVAGVLPAAIGANARGERRQGAKASKLKEAAQGGLARSREPLVGHYFGLLA